jgi:prepilin-type N-terminal cleavage/methylation domain-containing protein
MSPAVSLIKTKGFTLIELIVVTLLISLFLGFAGVNWFAFAKKDQETFLERLRAEVLLLREEAVCRYETQAMEFDLTGNIIRIGTIDTGNKFEGEGQVPMPKGQNLKDLVVNGSKVITGKPVVRFYPSGLVDKTVLHFEGTKEGVYSVVINPFTANMDTQDGYIEEVSLTEGNYPS